MVKIEFAIDCHSPGASFQWQPPCLMGWEGGVVCDSGTLSRGPVHCACQFSGDTGAIQSFVHKHLVPLLYQVLIIKARRLSLDAKIWPSNWQLTLSCHKNAGTDVQRPSQGKCGLSQGERSREPLLADKRGRAME